MFEVLLMRKDGIRLPEGEIKDQLPIRGHFTLDIANGAKRLRLDHPFSGMEKLELYEPVLISARNGTQTWRGYERVGDRGVVQEWYVYTKG
jgi:hypothetical protein